MKKKYKLDKEEKELLASMERGGWEPVEDEEARLQRYAEYAKNSVKKDKRISIRISNQDYVGIQARAMEEGLPYQTLITSVVHKYILGTLTLVKTIGTKKRVHSKKKAAA